MKKPLAWLLAVYEVLNEYNKLRCFNKLVINVQIHLNDGVDRVRVYQSGDSR